MRKILLSFIFSFASILAVAQLPTTNQKVLDYVKTVIGKKVDRGECWDLANAALTASNATFDRSSMRTIYTYGKKLNPAKDKIIPGDMIQFEKVKLKYKKGNAEYREEMPHHTAVVYKVYGPGHYQLAHQNTSFSGKKVGLSDLRLEDVSKGKMFFYRPQPKG
ncbi:MAG: hypothetical protein ACOCXH_02715 [Cyclobacteriaceae bacterium]